MVLLLPTLALAAKMTTAVADACPAHHTDIRIAQKIEPPRLDFTKGSDQLRTMKFNDLVSDTGFPDMAGLTVHSIAVDSEIRIASTGGEGAPICVWPKVITVTLSTAPTIYIAADDGGCRHGIALAHEMQHAAIDRGVIEKYGPIFRQRLAAMVDAIEASNLPSTVDLLTRSDRIEEKVNAMIAVTSDALNAEQVDQQRALDSPDEYKKRSAACPIVTFDAPQPLGGRIHQSKQ